MMEGRPYVGRFAPSPTGRLHLGSMVAAVASYLDAQAHGGRWLVRMEDLDPPREVSGAAEDILRTLEGFGLHWDGEVMHQRDRHAAYAHALETLRNGGLAFGCVCTRKDLADSNDLSVYPGNCRKGLPQGVKPRSWRFRMPDSWPLTWNDRIQGLQSIPAAEVGDVTLRRADDCWAYHLAVVVDDQEQGVTDIVRGEDLLTSTAAHLAIQRALDCDSIRYAHVPVVKNAEGQKLSKQTLAEPVEVARASEVLQAAFQHLKLESVRLDSPARMLQEATALWERAWL